MCARYAPSPLRLRGTGYPESLEVRGEILLPFVEFDRLNAERHRADLPLFANPRNAASGTLKQLDPAIVAERRLDAYLYYVPGSPVSPTVTTSVCNSARAGG